METNPPGDELPDQWPEAARQRLAALERAFATAEHRTQKYAQDYQTLQTQQRELQRDYASLRLQKGGFGFKSLLFAGMVGTFLGLGLCYFFFRPVNTQVETLRQFRQQHQFNLELAISQGKFAQADSLLKINLDQPANQTIRPELEFVRKINGAAWRRCEK